MSAAAAAAVRNRPGGSEDRGGAAGWDERGLASQAGFANEETRRAPIADYRKRDGTSLPAGTALATHGCGEHHPIDDAGDNVHDADNRRVEIFLFEDEIDPPVPTGCPAPGCSAYPAWVERSIQTVDFTVAAGVFDGFAFEDKDGARVAVAGASVHLSGPSSTTATTGSDGRVRITNLVAGSYAVVVRKAGYFDLMVDAAVSSAGGTTDLPLVAAAELRIRLIGVDGAPRAGWRTSSRSTGKSFPARRTATASWSIASRPRASSAR